MDRVQLGEPYQVSFLDELGWHYLAVCVVYSSFFLSFLIVTSSMCIGLFSDCLLRVHAEVASG